MFFENRVKQSDERSPCQRRYRICLRSIRGTDAQTFRHQDPTPSFRLLPSKENFPKGLRSSLRSSRPSFSAFCFPKIGPTRMKGCARQSIYRKRSEEVHTWEPSVESEPDPVFSRPSEVHGVIFSLVPVGSKNPCIKIKRLLRMVGRLEAA